MSNSNSSNKIMVPNGSVGGQMVKKMLPMRTARFERADRTAIGHRVMVTYRAGLYL